MNNKLHSLHKSLQAKRDCAVTKVRGDSSWSIESGLYDYKLSGYPEAENAQSSFHSPQSPDNPTPQLFFSIRALEDKFKNIDEMRGFQRKF